MIDPVYKHARIEAIAIFAVWLAATAYCCIYCYLYGYDRPGFAPGIEDIQPILGIPSWFFWGVLAPWAVCSIFTVVFAGFLMTDDDLGADHEPELEGDIRERAGRYD